MTEVRARSATELFSLSTQPLVGCDVKGVWVVGVVASALYLV